jgi:PIN domain nuclease of toxin-antitoxin system
VIMVDTHVAYWHVTGKSDLGKAARNILDSRMPVYFSPVTVFELRAKQIAGHLQLPSDLGASLISAGFTELPIKSEDFLHLTDFPSLANHDPMDRILLCQAARHNLRFLTADQKLLALGLDWVVDATA